MKICFNKKYNANIAIVILTSLILGRDLINISVPFIVFTAIVILGGLFTDSNGRLVVISYLLPFCRALPYSEMLLVVLGIELLCSIKKKKIHIKLYFPILGIIIIELLDYLRFDIFSNEIIYLVLYMIYATYVIDQKIAEEQEGKIAIAFSMGSIIAVISVVIREVSELGMNYITVYGVRFGSETNGRMVTNFNSNELGMYCAVAASFMIIEYLHNKKKINIVLGVIVSLLGFVSISRTYLIIIFMIWFYYIVKQLKSLRGIILTITMLIVTIYLFNRFLPDFTAWIMEYYAKRNKQSSIDGFGGRAGIMSTLFSYYFASIWSILFGYSEMYSIILGVGGAHNGLQEMLLSWGIIGFLVSARWIFILFKTRSVNSKTTSKKGMIPFCVFLLFIQTLQLFTMHNYLILMMLTIVYISSNFEREYKGAPWIEN